MVALVYGAHRHEEGTGKEPVRIPASRMSRAAAARRVAARRGRADGAARRLRDLLRNNLVGGIYPDGLLPGESELMLTHAATRAAVREALTMLREEGLVERVQGIGTFAVHQSRYISTIDELHGDLRDEAVIRRTRPEILDRCIVAAPDAVARKLVIDVGEPVLLLEYLAFVDGEAIGLATNYVKFPEADSLLTATFESDWYALLDVAGLPLGGSEWLLSATNADAAVAALLNLTDGAAVMLAEELIWDEDGRVYDFAICYIRTDRHVYLSRAGSFAMRETSETMVDRNVSELAVPARG
jgi:GntR family transcriptional regulator